MTEHAPDPSSRSIATKVPEALGIAAPEKYFTDLCTLITSAQVTGSANEPFSLEGGVQFLLQIIEGVKQRNNKIFLIGNGGSAAIASHQSVDFLNACGIPAVTFNDASLLTCMGNDHGYENIFAKPLKMLAQKGDLLLAISSSGKSLSILNAVGVAREKECFVATFSGFAVHNPLRSLGDINFYVQSNHYGFVEVAHLSLIHYVTDACKSMVR